MPLPHNVGRPTAAFCFGREELCDGIIRSSLEQSAVLLFGGRQSGKTTILLKLQETLRSRPDVLPIYVDLMVLSPGASASDLFRLFYRLAAENYACRVGSNSAFAAPTHSAAEYPFETFVADLAALTKFIPEPNFTFLFLVDEAKKLIGSDTAKGFQDNLFALLYGDTAMAGRCSMVFAGAQDLYDFCENQTSPIGSRAAFFFVTNLSMSDVGSILSAINLYDPAEHDHFVDLIYKLAGGNAGLTVRVAVRPDQLGLGRSFDDVVEEERSRHSGLLRIWASSLTPEARALQDLLLINDTVSMPDIPPYFRQLRLDPFASDRAYEEVQFTGIANREGGTLRIGSEIYRKYAEAFVVPQAPLHEEQSVWSLIEATETGLRKLVSKKYEPQWKDVEAQVKKTLGEDAWSTIQENKRKGSRAYRYSAPEIEDPLLDFMYLGQLVQLIIYRDAWDLFKHLFRDKRQLEDILADISPVRNDHAHFRRVPPRELLRCRLRCEDLLYLIEEEV
jgi:hypothetical protein